MTLIPRTYIQRDLEDQIAEEKKWPPIYCIREAHTHDYNGNYNVSMYTVGKEYQVFDYDGTAFLIICDTGAKTWASMGYFSNIKPRDKMQGVPEIKIADVKRLLKEGFTRYTNDPRNKVGSIQQTYGLTKSATADLFKRASLKGLKTKPLAFKVVEEGTISTTAEVKAPELVLGPIAQHAQEQESIFG